MKPIITVTAGHGAADPGNTWGGQREADLMDELGHIVALKLRQAGFEVREDGPRGENWPLAKAMKLVDGSIVAVELHTNASSNTAAQGVEVVARGEHRELAQRLANAIGGVLQIPTRRDRGWLDVAQLQRERGFMPGFVRAGGLIVETFFQSNPRELAAYQERKWLVASAIARELLASIEVPA
jgi:N-acetylmuramoyl-L-alanine amidase